MPILDIQIIGPMPESVREGLAQRLADAAGAVLGARPQNVWITLRFVEASQYAENAGAPANIQPVIVRLLLADPPEGFARRDQAARLTKVLAETLQRPAANIHLIYEPSARGRVSFGGRLLE